VTDRIPKPTRIAALVALAASMLLLIGAAPASAKKVKYGISPQTPLGATDFQQMNELKNKIVRYGLSWPGVQPNAGTCTSAGGACNWSFPDSQVGATAANGMESMLGVYGSPSFVESIPQKPPTSNIAAWEQFIAAAAERYGPGGTYWSGPYQAQFGAGAPVKPVRTWQIWNEPSSFQFFKPKPNVKKYAKILVPASKAIRSADKKATVLTGGMFPDTGPKGIPIQKYLTSLYKQKKVKSKTLDGVSVHPYAENAKHLKRQLSTARKAMNKSGGKKDVIWVTEIGYASGGPKKQEVVKKGEKGQAKAITQAYKFLKKSKGKYKIEGVVYFTWKDAPLSSGVCQFCVFAGLLGEDGSQKKAYKAYKKVAK
jgi:hypothetical protein